MGIGISPDFGKNKSIRFRAGNDIAQVWLKDLIYIYVDDKELEFAALKSNKTDIRIIRTSDYSLSNFDQLCQWGCERVSRWCIIHPRHLEGISLERYLNFDHCVARRIQCSQAYQRQYGNNAKSWKDKPQDPEEEA